MSVIFLHCKAVLSLPFPYCTLWKEVAMCCSHLRSVAPLPWEKSVYIIYWDFCMGDLFLFLHSFIHVGMESHRYLLFTLGDGPVWLSFVAKHVPGLAIGNSFSGLLCHVHMPPLFMAFSGLFLSNSLLSGTVRPSRLILCISCPSSPRSPGAFYWRMVLKTKIWVLGVLAAVAVSFLVGPLPRQREECVSANLYI